MKLQTTTNASFTIIDYLPEHQGVIRAVLEGVGWAEQYVQAMEQAAQAFARQPEIYGVYLAECKARIVGYVYVQRNAWNRLAQIQGLAVRPDYQRRGIAAMLVARAEAFAIAGNMRGIYVDTPVNNKGGRRFYEALGYTCAYVMPQYNEPGLDGVTYQKFFEGDEK